jgi:hypothetical protein
MMSRTCTVCTNPDRDAVDAAIVTGQPIRATAALFRVSEDALTRHAARHLPLVAVAAHQSAEAERGQSLLDQLRQLQARTLALLDRAEAAGKLTPAILAVGQARQNLELMARLLHELDERPQVNLIVSPEWLALRAALVEVLGPFPDAAAAVAARLVALEAG